MCICKITWIHSTFCHWQSVHGVELQKENIHILQRMKSVYFKTALHAKLNSANKVDWQVDKPSNYILDI